MKNSTCVLIGAVIDRCRDKSGSLGPQDISDLLAMKPNTIKLGDHDFDPNEHEVAEHKDPTDDPNFRRKRREPAPETINPVRNDATAFETDG